MAHELEINEVTGEARMLYVGQTPWHGLGTRVETEVTAEACIKLAGLDWTAKTQPMYLKGTNEIDGIPVIGQEIATNKAVVREEDNRILGVVGKNYKVIQNADCFEFMDELVGSGQALYHTAGSLFNGSKIFITMKMPEAMKIGDDVVDKYLLLSSAHDGSGAVAVQWTPIRVVCNNTLSAAIGRGKGLTQSFSIRHTSNHMNRIAEAREVLQTADMYYKNMEVEFNKLLDTQFSDSQMEQFVNELIPSATDEVCGRTKNRREELLNLTKNGIGIKSVVNTKWAAYNAVTELTSHRKGRDMGDSFGNDRKFESVLNTSGKLLRQKAFDLLTV